MSPLRGRTIAALALTLGTAVGLVAAAGTSIPIEPLQTGPQAAPREPVSPPAVDKSTPPRTQQPAPSSGASSQGKVAQPGIEQLKPSDDADDARVPGLPDGRDMMQGFMDEMRQMQALQESMHQRMRRFWEDSGFGQLDPFSTEPPDSFSRRAKDRLDAMRRGRVRQARKAPANPFDDFFDRFPGGGPSWPRSSSAFFSGSNLSDDGDHLTYRLESPGLTQDRVKLQLGDDTLVVEVRNEKTEKREERGQQGQGWSEYASSSAMKHVIHLPAKIDPARAKAEYTKDGLQITMPKASPAGRAGNSLGL